MRLESRRKLSKAKQGCVAWNKGLSTGPQSEKTRTRRSESLKGRTFTDEHRANLSKALKGRRAPWAPLNFRPRFGKPSKLTFMLGEILQTCGFEVIELEAVFWPFRVDVLLGEEWIGFEADGIYWHDRERLQREGKTVSRYTDQERDRLLLERYNLPIIRLAEHEIEVLYRELKEV